MWSDAPGRGPQDMPPPADPHPDEMLSAMPPPVAPHPQDLAGGDELPAVSPVNMQLDTVGRDALTTLLRGQLERQVHETSAAFEPKIFSLERSARGSRLVLQCWSQDMPGQLEELDCITMRRLCKGFDVDFRCAFGTEYGCDFQIEYQKFPALNSRTCFMRLRAYDSATRALWMQALRNEADLLPVDLEDDGDGSPGQPRRTAGGDSGNANSGRTTVRGIGGNEPNSSGWTGDNDDSSDEGFAHCSGSRPPRGVFPQSDDDEDEDEHTNLHSSSTIAGTSVQTGRAAPWWRKAHMQPRDLLSPETSPRARQDEYESLQLRMQANKLQRSQQSGPQPDRLSALEAQLEEAKERGMQRRVEGTRAALRDQTPTSAVAMSDNLQARRVRRAALESKLARMQEHRATRSSLIGDVLHGNRMPRRAEIHSSRNASAILPQKNHQFRARKIYVKLEHFDAESVPGSLRTSTQPVAVRFDPKITPTAFERLLRRQLRIDSSVRFALKTTEGFSVDPSGICAVPDGTEICLEPDSPPPSPPSSEARGLSPTHSNPPSPPNSDTE